RHRLVDAVGTRNLSGRHVGRAEEHIPYRIRGEIPVLHRMVYGMMPVVKPWRRYDPLQRAERNAHIAVLDLSFEEAIDREAYCDRSRNPQKGYRDRRQAGKIDGLEDVATIGGKPVELLDRMVHCMEAPERAPRVQCTVPPVVDEGANG